MGERTRWLAAEVALGLGILAVALATFHGAKAKFDSDEVHTIGTSRYFLTLFVERDFSAEAWPDDRWSRTHPMVYRYVVGAWLWARGYDLTAFDPRYDSHADRTQNARRGYGVSDAVLQDARAPMRVLAALAVAALYAAGRLAAGRIGGLTAALLACGSPYLGEHLIRAKGEAPLMAFLMLALAAGIAAARAGRRRARLAWGLAAGAALGLAMGAKLTGVLGMLAVAAWGLYTLVPRAGEHPPARSPAVAGVILATAILVFVASNPFLYRDPVGHTWLLFQTRQRDMGSMARAQPERAVDGLGERAMLVWERSLVHETWGSSYAGWPIEVGLAMLGAGWLVARGARRPTGADGLLLLWAVAIFGGVTWGLGFRLQHYFVPTALMAALLAGLGAGWAAHAAGRGLGRYGHLLPGSKAPGSAALGEALGRARRQAAPG